MKTATPVVVLRSNDVCFLGILRGFAAAGIPTIAVTFSWDGAPAWYSDCSSALGRRFDIANPYTEANTASRQLKQFLQGLYQEYGQKLMIIPSSDTNLMFLLDHYSQFEPYIKIMGGQDFETPRHDVIHKYQCANLLQQHCPELTPATMLCRKESDIAGVVANMVYPVVYKPATKDYGQTFYRLHGGNKAVQCDSPGQLKSKLQQEIANGFELVVQEKLDFESVYDEIPFYLYASADHQIRMAGNGIKEVIHPFPFGTALVLRFDWISELLPLAQQVVAALDYRGILMIEFVRDKKDGKWKVVEVNPRHWLFNGFYQRIGLNYSQCLAQDMAETLDGELIVLNKPMSDAAPVHVDLVTLARLWKEQDSSLQFTGYLSKIEAIAGSISDPFLDPDDPVPGERRIQDMLEEFAWPANGLEILGNKLIT